MIYPTAPTDAGATAYKVAPTPIAAAMLASMEAKARAPERQPKTTATKPKRLRPTPGNGQQHGAHVTRARPFLILRRAAISSGHDPLPLSYFASAELRLIADCCRCAICHPTASRVPPRGPDGWGISPHIRQPTSMGPGYRAPGVRKA